MQTTSTLVSFLALALVTVEARFSGKCTFYDLFPAAPVACQNMPVLAGDIQRLAAIDKSVFDTQRSSICGRCVSVKGPSGNIKVRIVDRCEGCGTNGIDLSRQGFPSIAHPDLGRVNVEWDFVPCEDTPAAPAASATAPSKAAGPAAPAAKSNTTTTEVKDNRAGITSYKGDLTDSGAVSSASIMSLAAIGPLVAFLF